MLSHLIHVLKSIPQCIKMHWTAWCGYDETTVPLHSRMCRMCSQGVTIWTQKPSAATCWVFCHVWLCSGIYQLLWQVTSLHSEVLLFSDISASWWNCTQGWLVLAGSNHCSELTSSLIHSVLVSKWTSYNNHLSTAGPNRKNSGLVGHAFYWMLKWCSCDSAYCQGRCFEAGL